MASDSVGGDVARLVPVDGAGPAWRTLRARQLLVVVVLFSGYAALYFCRADLSVATPLLVDELTARGLSRAAALVALGSVASFGVLAYAFGKLFLTWLGDFWGGRINFLIGLGGATAFTLLFTTGVALPLFTLAFVGNRLTQSLAWAGLIKVSSRWFGFSSYGTIIGVLSVSYLVGDALARGSMGSLIQHGFGWRALFHYAAAVAAVNLIASFLLLRESRTAAGFPEAPANPLNLFADAREPPRNIGELLRPLLRSPAFLIVCLLSLGCTIIRETFNIWTPEYLRDYLGYSAGRAGSISAIFPGVGVASVLLTGWLGDRLGVNGRATLMTAGLAGTALALLVLKAIPAQPVPSVWPLVAIGAIAFCLLGPYSCLGGAFALDFGGKQAGAVSSGLIDGVGYLGAVVAGNVVAQISVTWGWNGVFVVLAVISALAALAAGYLLLLGRRAARRARAA